ncbi:transposase [Streptomyces sp. NPDC001549]|uniref:transposase n=1 Tax=Streptomyces sp. NPDC001549 TaxID=3364586 RepID=UPI0036C57A7A
MAMKDYSDEFKADAVALYESTPGATYKSIAADLGINRATLREWVLRDRERRGVTTAGAKPAAAHGAAVPSADPDERVRRLEALRGTPPRREPARGGSRRARPTGAAAGTGEDPGGPHQ